MIWPVPALGAWLAAWLVFTLLSRAGAGGAWALAGAFLPAVVVAAGLRNAVRRLIVVAGVPALWLALGVDTPPWIWLVPLVLLAALYPLQAWRDAPLFPTPAGALLALPPQLGLIGQPRVLDAGCGLGHGLKALRAAWPGARVEGVERSAVLAWATRVRCPWAVVHRGDMWGTSWAGFDLVYLFQRPETMPRAWAKACAEMPPGRWLVSLEFDVPGVEPRARVMLAGERPVWAYQVPPSTPAPGHLAPKSHHIRA